MNEARLQVHGRHLRQQPDFNQNCRQTDRSKNVIRDIKGKPNALRRFLDAMFSATDRSPFQLENVRKPRG